MKFGTEKQMMLPSTTHLMGFISTGSLSTVLAIPRNEKKSRDRLH